MALTALSALNGTESFITYYFMFRKLIAILFLALTCPGPILRELRLPFSQECRHTSSCSYSAGGQLGQYPVQQAMTTPPRVAGFAQY